MVLKYYGIDNISQDLINRADPENKKGTNYKKLAEHLNELGFRVQLYSGDIEKLKSFIENATPVIVRQWFDLSKNSRHYRLVIGIDNEKKEIITHDPKKGSNYRFQKEEFLKPWKIEDEKTKCKSRNLMIVIENRQD